MSWIVPFNGKALEADPLLLDGFELSLIKRNTGLSAKNLIMELSQMDGEAIRALFWVVERRDNEELKFADYRGPNLELFMEHYAALDARLEALAGKVLGSQTATSGTNGTPTSPNGDGAEPSISL